MAAVERAQRNVNYWKIFYGRICQTSKEPITGFVERIVETLEGSKKAYVKEMDILGYIESVEFIMKEFENAQGVKTKVPTLEVKFRDTDGIIDVIQFKYTAEGIEFLKKVPNIDFTKRYIIQADQKKGKRTSIFLKEFDSKENVKNFYTKETPNGQPQPIETKALGGEVKLDWSPVHNFYYALLTERWTPMIAEIAKSRENLFPNSPVAQLPGAQAANTKDIPAISDEDDLPF